MNPPTGEHHHDFIDVTPNVVATDNSAPRAQSESSAGWAGGLTVFAGVVLIVVGVFQFFQGLAAIVKGSF